MAVATREVRHPHQRHACSAQNAGGVSLGIRFGPTPAAAVWNAVQSPEPAQAPDGRGRVEELLRRGIENAVGAISVVEAAGVNQARHSLRVACGTRRGQRGAGIHHVPATCEGWCGIWCPCPSPPRTAGTTKCRWEGRTPRCSVTSGVGCPPICGPEPSTDGLYLQPLIGIVKATTGPIPFVVSP